jgi:hypothetical protein
MQFIRTHGSLERADLHGILVALLSPGELSGTDTPNVFVTQCGTPDSLHVVRERSLPSRHEQLRQHDSSTHWTYATLQPLTFCQLLNQHPCYSGQWCTQEFCSGGGGGGVPTNSVEDRGQRERGSGGGSPPSQGFRSVCNPIRLCETFEMSRVVTDVLSTELGIRHSFVKTSEFRRGGFEHRNPPPSVRH